MDSCRSTSWCNGVPRTNICWEASTLSTLYYELRDFKIDDWIVIDFPFLFRGCCWFCNNFCSYVEVLLFLGKGSWRRYMHTHTQWICTLMQASRFHPYFHCLLNLRSIMSTIIRFALFRTCQRRKKIFNWEFFFICEIILNKRTRSMNLEENYAKKKKVLKLRCLIPS